MAGWKSVQEMIAYQLSLRLRDEVLRLTRDGPASRDWDFKNQIRDSVRSAPRNLAEGFTRYNHREFAYFANVAKGSLAETQNHLKDGGTQSSFSTEDFIRLARLAEEALRTCSGLHRYLTSSETPRPYWLPPEPPKSKRKRKGI